MVAGCAVPNTVRKVRALDLCRHLTTYLEQAMPAAVLADELVRSAALERLVVCARRPCALTSPAVLPRAPLSDLADGHLRLAFGLDVWDGSKVLSIEWDHKQSVLVAYRAGPWEQIAMAAGKA